MASASKEIVYRKARLSDLDGLVLLGRRLGSYHRQFFPDIYRFRKDYPSMQKKFYRKNIRSPKSLFFVAELDGKLIGFALAFARKYSPPVYAWKKEATLSDLYVEKPFRGKGVGERLFKEVAKFAENKGADMIKLHVDSKNAGARRFYEKMGMKDFHVLMVLRVKR